LPLAIPGCDTVLSHFKRQVTQHKNAPFLGTRPLLPEKDAKGGDLFGEYAWETFGQVSEKSESVAKAIVHLNYAP